MSKCDESVAYAYQSKVGRPIDAIWGLKSDGLFQSEAEASAAKQSVILHQGDIKYINQDGNETIDGNDKVYLGRRNDPLNLGINITLKWKDFTFFALCIGRFGASDTKRKEYYWCFGTEKYSELVRDRWTVNNKDASYPRLTTEAGDNNFQESDFWLYKKDRFDLSQVQLTYSLPKSIIGKTFIKGLNIYLSGYNLLTIAKERKILEMNIGGAPQTRLINLGFKGTF